MARTALEMSADELKQYKPFSRKRQGDEFLSIRFTLKTSLFQQAWEIARQAASLLHEKFDAQRVVIFGPCSTAKDLHTGRISILPSGESSPNFFSKRLQK